MATGTVKWFNDDKGFGFIEQELGEDLFVHYSEIQVEGYKTLEEGDEVEFEMEETEKGLAAVDVKPTNAAV
ncbi:MAG: cold-shock protein [bacterium]